MRKFRILFYLVLVIATSGCKKDIVKADKNFVGYWEYDNNVAYYEMNITSLSHATYNSFDGTKDEFHVGEAKVHKRKGEVIIGDRKWKIDSYPRQVNDPTLGTVWKMSLDGIEYTKQ